MTIFIEDESEDGYTLRTDLLKEGEKIQCQDDGDMHVKKEGEAVILVKKCFQKNCFS